MTLKTQITQHIKTNGPISVAEYMAMCLYTPESGYYMHGMPFGKEGDFITAPELTPLFGEMLGLWVAATWQQMGAPKAFSLIEFGPGRGTLFTDMLRAIAKALPPCFEALEGHLVDVSPHLKNLQQEALKNARRPLTWHSTIETLPTNKPTIALGNELLDAFPIQQFTLKNNKYFERLVAVEGEELAYTHAAKPTILPTDDITGMPDVIEKSPALDGYLTQLKKHLEACPQSVLMLIDYGADTSTSAETLQALSKHKFVGIFDTPGQADLTWHIPFKKVCAILGAEQTTVTDMALFLTEIGFAIRAEQAHRAATTDDAKEHIERTTHRLLSPNDMGQHFKVLGWQSPQTQIGNLQGFLHAHASSE